MEHICLECSDIKEEFKCFFVKTTTTEIEECLDNMRNETTEDVRAIYIGSSTFLQRFTKDKLIELHNKKTKNWENWCNDVLLFYVTRFIIFGEKIPIVKMECDPIKQEA